MPKNKDRYVKRMVEPSASNPFMNELARTIVSGKQYSSISTKTHKIINTQTGEISEHEAVLSRAKIVEKNEFLKIFSAGIAAMFDLPRAGQDMFKSIMRIYLAQKFTPETVYINADTLKEIGYNRQKATRIKAMNILINNGFIAEVKNRPHQFWINPNMFYKGNRMTLVQSYAVRGSHEGASMEQAIVESRQEKICEGERTIKSSVQHRNHHHQV